VKISSLNYILGVLKEDKFVKKHNYLKVLAVAVFIACFAQAASAEKVLKLGTVGFKGMPIGDAIAEALIPTLNEVSGGKMKIEPHYRKSLCSEQSCGEQANQGLIALWTSSTANFGNFGTALSVFDLPYIFKSIEDADRISTNWLAKKQCDIAAEEAGHVCLTVYSSGGFRQLGNAHGPVHVPDDMKGIKWRVTKSPIEYTLIKNWGAVPVPYDWAQLYQGLQTGVVSGQYVATPWQHVAKLHEVAKYFTEIGGSWSGNQLSMDKRQYDELTNQERKWLHTAADAFGKHVQKLDRDWVTAGEKDIKAEIKEWYVPNEEEMKLWRAGAVDAWLNAKGSFDPATAERVLEEQGLNDFIATLKTAGAL
jgi:TRAP-type C4-dicarboxylate transport system substrate-binding protein